MILSVSRRTDIPNYYSDWFLKRIDDGYVYVRNPMNIHRVSKIDISAEVVDCIVFWTKNPEPMFGHLNRLKHYHYYFQFTLTGYGNDIEPYLPDKREQMIPIFQRLSSMIGKEKVIWRYDPIVITDKYSVEYHIKVFSEIASCLQGYCNRVVISFIDMYTKTKKNMKDIQVLEKGIDDFIGFSATLAKIAKQNGMVIETCSEQMDLSSCGIKHSSCIDKTLIEQIIGSSIKVSKDKNQRTDCGCVESIDIGAYNTCFNGCKYCYANYSDDRVKVNTALYDVNSPILCSHISEVDSITERNMKSLKDGQVTLFDLF